MDSGSWTVDRLVFGSPLTLLFGDVETTLVGAGGSFRVDFHGGTTPAGLVAAPWRAYWGTGVYGGITGNGTWTQAYDPSTDELTFTLTGRVRLASS